MSEEKSLKIGILIPHFPEPTHIMYWREIKGLRSMGEEVYSISTKKADLKFAHQDFSEVVVRETFYVYPPKIIFIFYSVIRSLKGLARAIGYISSLSESNFRSKIKAIGFMFCAAGLATYCRMKKIDHIHVHSCANSAHIVAMCYLMGGPTYSLHLHGDLEVYGGDHKSKMKYASFVATDARPFQEQVIKKVGIPSERTCTMWMGLDTGYFLPLEKKDFSKTFRITTIARLHFSKGHVYVLGALCRLLDMGYDIHYIIAGEGYYRSEIESMIKGFNLTNNVEMLGAVSEKEDLDILHRIDASVLASIGVGEGAPVAIKEAMSCGLPVICSIIGGTPDMITNNVNGILVEQGNEEALVNALASLYNDRGLCERLGKAARMQAIKNFDSRELALILLKKIKEVKGRQSIGGYGWKGRNNEV